MCIAGRKEKSLRNEELGWRSCYICITEISMCWIAEIDLGWRTWSRKKGCENNIKVYLTDKIPQVGLVTYQIT